MAQANLLNSFWGDAMLAAAYNLNRVPLETPSILYELWNYHKLELAHSRT